MQPDPSRLAALGLTLADLEQAHQGRLGERLAAACSSAAPSSSSSAARACSRSSTTSRRVRVATARGHAGLPQGRGRRDRGLGAAPGRGQPRRRRSTPSRASCSCAAARTRRWCSSALRAAIDGHRTRASPADGAKRRPVLRPHRARRHHAQDRGAQPARGRGAGHAGALRLPARPARGADRGSAHPALAALRRSSTCTLRGMSREPALDGRGRLRRSSSTAAWSSSRAILARLRADATPGRDAEPMHERIRRGDGDGGAADGVRAAHHHRRLPAHLPARAGRGPHLRAHGEHGGRGAGRARWSSRSRWCRCWPRSSYRKPVTAPRVAGARAGGAAPTSRRCASRLRRPVLVLAVARRGSLAGAAMVLPRLGSEFLPELNEGALYMTFTLPSNISLDRGPQAGAAPHPAASQQRPQVDDGPVAARPARGRHRRRRSPTTSSSSSSSSRPSEWPRADADAGRRASTCCSGGIDEIPGLEVNFCQPIRDNVNENISGQFGQIAVKLYGDDLGGAAGPGREGEGASSPRCRAWPTWAS